MSVHFRFGTSFQIAAGLEIFTIVGITQRAGSLRGDGKGTRFEFPGIAEGLISSSSVPWAGEWDFFLRIPLRTPAGTYAGRFVLPTSDPNRNSIPVTLIVFPAPDADGDALPDLWEQRMGLSVSSAAGENGASDDPDGDGLTNAAEFAAHSHPRGQLIRYFAEGVWSKDFWTGMSQSNPRGSPSPKTLVRYLRDDGAVFSDDDVQIGLNSGPLVNHAFAVVVESDSDDVDVRRSMTLNSSLNQSESRGVPSLSASWWFAEGSTRAAFDTFFLVANQNDRPATAAFEYLLAIGDTVRRTYTVAPHARLTVWANQEPALADMDFGLRVTATAAVPLVVERAMYVSQHGAPFVGGTVAAGTTALSTQWIFAEGASGARLDTYLLLANPGSAAANVAVTYLLSDGRTVTRSHMVAPRSRSTVFVDHEGPELADASFGISVLSTNGVEIVAERAMWWDASNPAGYQDGHAAMGVSAGGTGWFVWGYASKQYLLIVNPGAQPANLRITPRRYDGVQQVPSSYSIPPTTRVTIDLATVSPVSNSFLVESTDSTPTPLVVEHALYSSGWPAFRFTSGDVLSPAILSPRVSPK